MNSFPLLLADRSANLRLLVLRELMDRSEDDSEVLELSQMRERDPLVDRLVSLQQKDGSWRTLEEPHSRAMGSLRSTVYALARLGYMGFTEDFAPVKKGAEYLFRLQGHDGSWPIERWGGSSEEEGYSMIPLQTAIPLKGLAACGYAADPRAETAYEWLLGQRLPDGAWPSGIASGNWAGVAGYRRLPHSRWGCRCNTTGALLCLALHPKRSRCPEAQRGLDLLLGRETRERYPLGFEIARILGLEGGGGILTHHARFDIALILDLCWRIGASLDDDRVASAVGFVREAQGSHGLWEYLPSPQVSRWLTFDLLRSLSRLGAGRWVGMEPRTPFKAYPAKPRRY